MTGNRCLGSGFDAVGISLVLMTSFFSAVPNPSQEDIMNFQHNTTDKNLCIFANLFEPVETVLDKHLTNTEEEVKAAEAWPQFLCLFGRKAIVEGLVVDNYGNLLQGERNYPERNKKLEAEEMSEYDESVHNMYPTH